MKLFLAILLFSLIALIYCQGNKNFAGLLTVLLTVHL